MKDGIEKLFYSRKEAAEILCCSIPTLARRLVDGSIPFKKLGGRVLIPAEFFTQFASSALQNQGRQ